MPHILWTPWRDRNEILTVRSQLFPSSGSQRPDLRQNACSQISAWKLRGSLPHAIESTWYLTDAVLTDNIKANKLTPLAVRACYSTAFCRFVTGLVDSEQDSKYKISMYVKAKEIGIPASFVELRHEATHGDLPSLAVLRRASEKALEWLWNDYWQYLDVRTGNLDEDEVSAFKNGREQLRENFRNILRSYVSDKSYVANVKPVFTTAAGAKVSTIACLKLAQICRGERLVLAELIVVFLEYKVLVPSSKMRVLGRHMDEVFSTWYDLLQMLSVQQEQFLTMLIDAMIVHITSPSLMDVSIDPYREAIAMWLIHICTAQQWAPTAKKVNLIDNPILSSCLQNPNHWTLQLAMAIVDAPGHSLAKELFGERIAKTATAYLQRKDPLVQSISLDNLDHLLPSQRTWLGSEEGQIEQRRSAQQQDTGKSFELSENGGWEKWKGVWISKPIGIV